MENEIKIPHYKRLYELLRKQINEGTFIEGDLLPSENELCKSHSVTRPTVRHALEALLHEGYIKKHKGKGSIVHQIPDGIGILSIKGTTSAVGKHNLKTKIIVKPEIVKWPENFIFSLNDNEKNSGCIYFERLRLVNNVPVFYDITYIPNINLPRFTTRKFEDKSLFETLRKYYHLEVKSGEQVLKAVPADKIVSKHLNVSENQPILHLERKLNTNREGFRFYSSLYCNTEHYGLYGSF